MPHVKEHSLVSSFGWLASKRGGLLHGKLRGVNVVHKPSRLEFSLISGAGTRSCRLVFKVLSCGEFGEFVRWG
jgi:hypothetical protein